MARVIMAPNVTAIIMEQDGTVAYLMKKGLQAEAVAKHLCPVDTGRLRSSITTRLVQDGAEMYAIIGTNVAYAKYVEFGTRKWIGKPFLRPALYAIGGRVA